MDTILNLIPGRKQLSADEPNEEAIKRTHDFLRSVIEAFIPCVKFALQYKIRLTDRQVSVAPLDFRHHSSYAELTASLCIVEAKRGAFTNETTAIHVYLNSVRQPFFKVFSMCSVMCTGREPRVPPSLRRLRGKQPGRCWISAGHLCWEPSQCSLKSSPKVMS